MKPLKSVPLFFLILFTVQSTIVRAQTMLVVDSEEKPATQVVVTFTFPSSAGDYSIYQDESKKDRYYVKFATANLPSYQIAPATAAVKLMVDNEKSNQGSLVFWIPVRSGTSPRIDRNQSTLTLTFTPGSAQAATLASVERSVGRESNGSTFSAPANPVNQPTPTLQPQSKAESNPLSLANVDLAVPESPAFTVLGLTPETVVRPNSPRQFATALLSGVDRNGNFQSGTALDTVPYLLLAGRELTLKQYQTSYKLRLASRTQFSFATTKGASEEDKSVRLSLGLRMTLWDKGDPRTDSDLMKCFDDASRKYLAALKTPDILPLDQLPPTASEEEKLQSVREWAKYEQQEAAANPTRLAESEECRAESRKKNWNKSSWIVAYAPSWISTSGETKNFNWNGGGIWTSVAYGFEGFPGLEKHSQIIFHGRYRSNEQVPDPENQGSFLSQDSYFFGARARVGNENSTGSFEGVFVRSRPEGKSFDTSARYSVGLERRIAENLWFALAFGGENGRADGRNKGFVLTSFKWGFSEKRQLPLPK
jgi:hypothetical protein